MLFYNHIYFKVVAIKGKEAHFAEVRLDCLEGSEARSRLTEDGINSFGYINEKGYKMTFQTPVCTMKFICRI